MDYQPLIDRWQASDLQAWAERLPEQLATGLSLERFGDLPRWMNALAQLPDLRADNVALDASRVGAGEVRVIQHHRSNTTFIA